MDDREKERTEFDLEDILKEFADESQETSREIPEEEDVLIWEGVMPESVAQNPPMPQDTVRLDEITKAVRQQEEAPLEQTIAFTPVGEEEEAQEPMIIVPEELPVEPYSEEWEPEYEQPIGEYIPPEPIVFRPKSRLRELKRKLVAGPEKRYYELSEQGLGKLQMAIFASFLVAIVSACTTAMYAMGVISTGRVRFVIFVQFISLLLSALFGSYQLMEGFGDILKRRFTLNSLLLFSLTACLADSVLCLRQLRVPCCAAFSLNMTMSLWSAYQKRNTEMGQMDTMRKAIRLDSLVAVKDCHEGRTGFVRAEGQVENFMDTYKTSSGAEKCMSIYALVVLVISLAIGIVAGVRQSMSAGLQAFAAALLVAVPPSAYIATTRPMAILERRLHKVGTVLCGWQGVRQLSGNGVFPVQDEDLFPAGAAKMNGVKFYGRKDPDEVVAYAAALIAAGGGGMVSLFNQLLESRNGYHYEAEGLRSYPGGIGAVINEEAVLAGTLSFMQDMGVEMPRGTRVNQAIYVAIDGQLCGVFAITYTKTKSAAAGITTLCAYRKLTPVLTGGDFMLTESFLRGKFGINTRRMAFPDRKIREEIRNCQPEEGAPALALMTQEGLAGAAYAVTGARALRGASIAGVAVHMLGGILGLVIMLLLGIVGGKDLLTPVNVLLYELIWMIPGLLITEWTRSV